MFQRVNCRAGHYLLLLGTWAALCLVNLGAPSLWDIDEGNNAEAAREMYESGNWVVPTFNFQLRVDKPALLYWLQGLAYHRFGVNEFSARLPSALAALASVLLTYELGRRIFGAGTGLLAGLVLASTVLFCASAHFANPDALLNACTLLTFFFFWRDFERGGNSWLVLGGISTGLGMLAKGPVGLVLPIAALGLFLLWTGQPRRWLRPALLGGGIVFFLIAGPWYAWVAADTKAEFLRGFFLKHNVGRFLQPMENHKGGVLYYLLILLAGFAPWSVFFVPVFWSVVRSPVSVATDDGQRTTDKYRFLGCWMAVYLLFFTLSSTKLPNYVLPLYPPLSILVAHFLDRWRRGEITAPARTLGVSLASLCLMGVLLALGLLIAGGALARDLGLLRGRHLPGLEKGAALGLVPLLGGLAGWWCLRGQRRGALVAAVALSAVVFVGALAGWGSAAVERHKAPRVLAAVFRTERLDGDVLVGAYDYFQPSLVFYCRRQIMQWPADFQALHFLNYPVPVYLFVPARTWERLRPYLAGPHRELARQRDLYRGCDVVLVTNR
jgi:4-amino-4-deoxy-L-arabinose transferase-like glycosyltransferase